MKRMKHLIFSLILVFSLIAYSEAIEWNIETITETIQVIPIYDGDVPKADLYLPPEFPAQMYYLVVLSPGFGGTKEDMSEIAMRLAAENYIVVVFNPPGIYLNFLDTAKYIENIFKWDQDFIKTIDYITDSLLSQYIYLDKIGAGGHSWGGMSAGSASLLDSRIKVMVLFSPATVEKPFSEITVPTLTITGTLDFLEMNNFLYVYPFINAPKQIIDIIGAGHCCFAGADHCFPWIKEISAYYCIAWFDYYLKDDKNALNRIKASFPMFSRGIYNFGDGDVQM